MLARARGVRHPFRRLRGSGVRCFFGGLRADRGLARAARADADGRMADAMALGAAGKCAAVR